MKLQEIFDQLSVGELSQLAIGGSELGEIEEDNYPRLLAHINLGLSALYKRFYLKESRLTVALQAGVLTYPLEAADLMKVEKVVTEPGFELPLNDEANPYSVFTPSAAKLSVPKLIVDQGLSLPDQLKTSTLDVVYRANHPKLVVSLGYFNPARIEVELPETHLEALLMFVASRIHNPIGMTGEFNAGNNYAMKYEQACQVLEMGGYKVDKDSQNDRLYRNGRV